MNIAIVGATGVVGREILQCLAALGVPVSECRLMASPRSVGLTVETPFGPSTIREMAPEQFDHVRFAFFCAGRDVSRTWAPAALAHGATVIDSSSEFRMNPEVPLVIPEINGHAALGKKLIAKPNCTTTIAALAVYPIYRAFGVRKMIVSTYQAASGAGRGGMEELETQTRRVLAGEKATPGVFPHQLAMNLIPHIDRFDGDGHTGEEMKIVRETRKIFRNPELAISCTCVRVPVPRVHCESIVLETEKPVTPERARQVLRDAPGVEVRDEPGQNLYPMPISATGKYAIEVGRIRHNRAFGEHGLEMFVAGDQILKGAALNAVQIAQYILSHAK